MKYIFCFKKIMTFLGIYLIVATIFIGYTINQNRSNYTSYDGVYASYGIIDWIHDRPGKSSSPDKIIYNFGMSKLLNLFPQSFHAEIFQRMTIINTFFGALFFTVLLFWLKYLKLKTLDIFLVSLFHLSMAGFMITFSICDDVMPAYFFSFLTLIFIHRYHQNNKKNDLVFAGLFLSLTHLTHWTLIIQLLPMILGLLIIQLNQTKSISKLILFLSSYFIPLFLAAISLSVSLKQIFFPFHKINGEAKSWIGFESFQIFTHKLTLLLLGIFEYVFRGENLYSLEDFHARHETISIIMLFSILLFSIIKILHHSTKNVERAFYSLWKMAFFIFIVGQLVNLYHQPQLSQFQIQPMFFLTVSYILLLILYPKLNFKFYSFLLIISVLSYNIVVINGRKGEDNKQMSDFNKIEKTFDFKKDFFISSGISLFNAFYLTLDPHFLPGERNKFELYDLFLNLDEKKSLEIIKRETVNKNGHKRKIFSDDIINLTEEEAIKRFKNLAHPHRVIPLIRFLKTNFKITKIIETDSFGQFFLLEQKTW